MRLYDDPISGNGYKVRLLLAQLGRDYDYVPVHVLKGETRRPDFLARNPNGRIPVLELDDGAYLPESGAILWYLAEGTPFVPDDRLARARVLQWMFFEQYSHEPYVAVLRFWAHLPKLTALQEAQIPERRDRGEAALAVMERHLAGHAFFAGAAYSIADIALYAYTHVADEGGFDLTRHPRVTDWLARVAAQPGHVTIDAVPAV